MLFRDKTRRMILIKILISSWLWWHVPVISALGRQKQEDHEFKFSWNYTI
jgi:hypothetical protein